jgi:hypothetical protein
MGLPDATFGPALLVANPRRTVRCKRLFLVIDLECALDKILVERNGRQTVDRQHCGTARSTLVHNE